MGRRARCRVRILCGVVLLDDVGVLVSDDHPFWHGIEESLQPGSLQPFTLVCFGESRLSPAAFGPRAGSSGFR